MRPARALPFGVLFVVLLLMACGRGAEAPVPPMPDLPEAATLKFAGRPFDWAGEGCQSAILIEASTGTVLYEKNAHESRPPASIAKMMLELVVMREIEAERLSLQDSIRVSGSASKLGGSQVYLAQGESFTLEEMMEAIAVGSANDACVAVAEHIAGTPRGFVELMNREAELLGLESTVYKNVHGLDDDPAEINLTTAADIARLARELVRYPDVLRWSSTPKADFRGGAFLLQNTNELVGRFPGLDGLKTGYTSKAGFCLCATAQRDDLRFISVVLGCDSNRGRFRTTQELLGMGFGTFLPVEIVERGSELDAEVAIPGGKLPAVRPVAAHDLTVILTRPDDRLVTTRFVAAEDLRAPLEAWEPVGEYQVVIEDRVLASVPAWTPVPVPAKGFLPWVRSLFG